MARVRALAEMLVPLPEMEVCDVEAHLGLVGREAAFVERVANEWEAGHLGSGELRVLLENLAARLAKLANPASPWRGIGGR